MLTSIKAIQWQWKVWYASFDIDRVQRRQFIEVE